jgi:hypothetical protein
MTYHPAYLANHVLLTTCLALACVTGAATGCGGDSAGGSVAQIDSELLGIYAVDLYQTSPECGELMDAQGAPRLVLYSATLNNDPEQPVLAGQFCGSVEDCRARAEAGTGGVNYSFFEGDDAQGWLGYGIASQGSVGEQCQVDVQIHMLTSTSDQAIKIDTEEVETVYQATIDGANATCSIQDAIQSITDESPCTGLFLVEATFEADL